MRRVLVANRAEIAVRVIRACRDTGTESVAVYAEPDLDALHVRLADHAFALGGTTPAESYLDIGKILRAAADSGADAVHPGYGFLSEDAEFARAVIDAGLTWIGPPPEAIAALGDKLSARRIAARLGVPLLPGTSHPVRDVAGIVDFAEAHGLPVAIKAAHGGGGRGLKVARTLADIPAQYDSAVREAQAAFGRPECFVERFLDRPRHVETQCLADAHGNVVVVSTRDCSLQRRNQKLVEEAPAPFLSPEQVEGLYRASKAILREVGYVGAGTCEFLLGVDGSTAFLEVNTRLQVEHPVTEEITGIDLVAEQFRLARGERLGYDDPPSRGHAIEFRINSEDAGRGFLPTPGTVRHWRMPAGPGVRVDSGVSEGTVIGAAWDSLLAKLIVSGADRAQALARSRRALAEFEVGGAATLLPFHRRIVDDPAFAGPLPRVHTRWVEECFVNDLPPQDQAAGQEAETEWQRMVAEVNGRRVEVALPIGRPAVALRRPVRGRPRRSEAPQAALLAPMQGTVISVEAGEGEMVEAGATVVVIEAMKMEQPVAAHRSGTVRSLGVSVGSAITAGTLICEIG